MRSDTTETITPVSSSRSSWIKLPDLAVDLRRGLADEGEDTERRRPNAAAALGFRDFVMRDERAGVVCILSCADVTSFPPVDLLRLMCDSEAAEDSVGRQNHHEVRLHRRRIRASHLTTDVCSQCDKSEACTEDGNGAQRQERCGSAQGPTCHNATSKRYLTTRQGRTGMQQITLSSQITTDWREDAQRRLCGNACE